MSGTSVVVLLVVVLRVGRCVDVVGDVGGRVGRWDAVLGVHHGEVVVDGLYGTFSSGDCETGMPAAPVSTVAIMSGGVGVTGAGGRLQSLPDGAGVFKRPSARLIARSSGNGSEQQRLEKSSKSMVQAAIPPYPALMTYFAFLLMSATSSNPTH